MPKLITALIIITALVVAFTWLLIKLERRGIAKKALKQIEGGW